MLIIETNKIALIFTTLLLICQKDYDKDFTQSHLFKDVSDTPYLKSPRLQLQIP